MRAIVRETLRKIRPRLLLQPPGRFRLAILRRQILRRLAPRFLVYTVFSLTFALRIPARSDRDQPVDDDERARVKKHGGLEPAAAGVSQS